MLFLTNAFKGIHENSAFSAVLTNRFIVFCRDTSAGQVHNYIHQHNHFNHRHTRNLSQVDSVYIQKQIIEIIGDRHCPPAEDSLNSSVVHMCPLYHAIEYDENRIPSVMRQVRGNSSITPLKTYIAVQLRLLTDLLIRGVVLVSHWIKGLQEGTYLYYIQSNEIHKNIDYI